MCVNSDARAGHARKKIRQTGTRKNLATLQTHRRDDLQHAEQVPQARLPEMNVQKFDHPANRRLITGVSGTGKTTHFLATIASEKARLKFIFDHQGEFARKLKIKPCFTADEIIQAADAGGWILFDPVDMANELDAEGKRRGVVDCFDFFCGLAFAICEVVKGRKLFICDELQKLTTTRNEPDELLSILDTGRRWQIDFYGISQAPNRIHNAIRNQITHITTFRQSDANAVAYLADNGFSADEIRNLRKGEYLWRDLDSGEDGRGGKAF